jgi:hypothetical protein
MLAFKCRHRKLIARPLRHLNRYRRQIAALSTEQPVSAQLFTDLAVLAADCAARTSDGTANERLQLVANAKGDSDEYFRTLFGSGPLVGQIGLRMIRERVKGEASWERKWYVTAKAAAKAFHDEACNRSILPADDKTAHVATMCATFGGWIEQRGEYDRPKLTLKEADVGHAQAFFAVVAELDKTPLDSLRKLLGAGLWPTMLVGSGGLVNGETTLHAYYAFEVPALKSEIERVKDVAARLVAFSGGDTQFRNVVQTIRAPGQLHRKAGKPATLARLIECSGELYSLSDLEGALPAVPKPTLKTSVERHGEMADWFDAIVSADETHTAMRSLINELMYQGMRPDTVFTLVQCLLDLRAPGEKQHSDKEIQDLIASGMRRLGLNPHYLRNEERRAKIREGQEALARVRAVRDGSQSNG